MTSRKVFFSFHFKRDAWRAGQVRNSDMLADEDEYGVIDAVEWEKIEREGDEAIKRWINDQLKYTSVTVVLIGVQTAERDWVDYELRRSWERGNGIVGVRIHNLKNQDGSTDTPGPNPLDNIKLVDGTPLSSIFKTYDWNVNDGRSNLGQWVEEAFQTRAAYQGETTLADGDPSRIILARTRSSYEPAGPTIIQQNPPRPWAQ